jgi:regulatory protein
VSGPPDLPARVVSIERSGRSGRRARIELDDGSRLEVAAHAAEAEGLGAGDPVDEALRARLLDRDLRWRTREAALGLLDVRARSREELARRLSAKTFPRAIVEACLADLEASGFIDDAAFARMLVRDRLRLNPRSPGRLRQELRARGVAAEVAGAAVESVFEDERVTVSELAREAALGWLRRQPPALADALGGEPFTKAHERARRRLHGYLARRGFQGSLALEAVEAAEAAAREAARSQPGADTRPAPPP